MIDLDELQRLAEGATPGDWTARQRTWGYPEREGEPARRLWEIDADGVNIAGLTICSRDEQDAAYIAAMSPDTVKKLIAAARAAITIAECKSADPNRGRSNEGRWTTINALAADFEALRTALEELKK